MKEISQKIDAIEMIGDFFGDNGDRKGNFVSHQRLSITIKDDSSRRFYRQRAGAIAFSKFFIIAALEKLKISQPSKQNAEGQYPENSENPYSNIHYISYISGKSHSLKKKSALTQKTA